MRKKISKKELIKKCIRKLVWSFVAILILMGCGIFLLNLLFSDVKTNHEAVTWPNVQIIESEIIEGSQYQPSNSGGYYIPTYTYKFKYRIENETRDLTLLLYDKYDLEKSLRYNPKNKKVHLLSDDNENSSYMYLLLGAIILFIIALLFIPDIKKNIKELIKLKKQ